jgi:hypothetical protein
MSNLIKTFYIITLGTITFFGNNAFAELRPTFENQEVAVLKDGIVRFEADFNSNNNDYFPTNQPITWFIFGENMNNLRHETPKKNRIKGEYIVSQGATLFQEDTIYYVQSLMMFENELTEGEIISFNPYIPNPIALNDQGVSRADLQNQGAMEILNTADQSEIANRTLYGLQPPLNYSLNLLDFFSLQRSEKEPNTVNEIIEDKEPEKESISLFQNSATNSYNFDNTVSQKDDTKINKVGLQGNGLTASAASSGISIPLVTYLTVFLLIIMVAVATLLWRSTNKKKRRLYHATRPDTVDNYPQDLRYNEN